MLTIELQLHTVVELGCGSGDSTVALLSAAQEVGGQVTSVDIDACDPVKVMLRQASLDGRWTFLHGDDMEVEPPQPIDHLFIDTSHTFDHTLNELGRYEPLVRSGGVITMHDIVSYPAVFDAAKQYMTDRNDLRAYPYFNCNGMLIIFKR
jgi:predicted O-methyltransferase YrrM